jgi:hypothetical protein
MEIAQKTHQNQLREEHAESPGIGTKYYEPNSVSSDSPGFTARPLQLNEQCKEVSKLVCITIKLVRKAAGEAER